MSRVLAVIATVLFAVGFVLVAFTNGNTKLVSDCLYLGLAFLAGAHAV